MTTARASTRLLVPITDTCNELGGLSRTTVYELVKNGELVKVNIGTRSFITAESLGSYVRRLADAATAIRSTRGGIHSEGNDV